MLVAALDGKRLTEILGGSGHGIRPGNGLGRRECRGMRRLPGPEGRQRSAGTFSKQRQADRAWQRAEGKVAQGHLGDPSRGRRTFRDYVEQTWLPNHEIEASTRQSYTYVLRVRSCRSSARCG